MTKYTTLLKAARNTSTNWQIVTGLYRSFVNDLTNDETRRPVDIVIEVERLTGIMRDYARRRGETFHAFKID